MNEQKTSAPSETALSDTAPSETALSDTATSEPAPSETAPSDISETIIFGADWCGDCRRAKRVFDSAGAAYRYVDLIADPASADVARDISGRTNIPVILYSDGSHQVEPSNADMQRKIDELGLASRTTT